MMSLREYRNGAAHLAGVHALHSTLDRPSDPQLEVITAATDKVVATELKVNHGAQRAAKRRRRKENLADNHARATSPRPAALNPLDRRCGATR